MHIAGFRTHPHWRMWIWSDWSDWRLCVPLSALSLAVPPLASSWVCRHSISASLEARSCCSSEISACGKRKSACLWTASVFQVTGYLGVGRSLSARQLDFKCPLIRIHTSYIQPTTRLNQHSKRSVTGATIPEMHHAVQHQVSILYLLTRLPYN